MRPPLLGLAAVAPAVSRLDRDRLGAWLFPRIRFSKRLSAQSLNVALGVIEPHFFIWVIRIRGPVLLDARLSGSSRKRGGG